MLKKVIAGAVWGAAVLLASCQGTETATIDRPTSMASSERVDFDKIQAKREKYTTRGPKPTNKPQEAFEYFYQQRLGPGMDLYPIDRLQRVAREVKVVEAERRLQGTGPIAGITTWEELGPGNIGGRTRAILVNPNDPDFMYAAGVSGGVFKTADGGMSWAPTGDFLANIAVNAMAFDPGDVTAGEETIYAGTGEGFFNGDAVRGLGIFKSEDGGETWTQLEGTTSPRVPAESFYYVNKLQATDDAVYAATRSGVWRSEDDGETWTAALGNGFFSFTDPDVSEDFTPPDAFTLGSSAGATDIQVDTSGPEDVLYAAFGSFVADGLFKSEDGGETWDQLGTFQDVARFDQGRMTISIAPTEPDTVYVAMSDAAGRLLGIYRSMDAGETWELRLDPSEPVDPDNPIGPLLFSNVPFANGCFGDLPLDQGWYDNIIKVDPTDADTVWVGGVDIFRSDDGGETFGVAGYWYLEEDQDEYIHADHHEIVFHPDYNGGSNQTMFVGNDGGIYRTENALAATGTNTCVLPGATSNLPEIDWVSLNNGYGVTQFYHGDSSQQNDVFIGGTQDNGTNRGMSRTTPNAWDIILGGDGGYVQIDPTNDQIVIAETQGFPSIRRSEDGGNTFTDAVDGIDEEEDSLFIVPIHMAPAMPSIVWTGGERPWRSMDQALSWEAAGTEDEFDGVGFVSAIATAPSDPDRVYIGFNSGQVATTTNGLSASPAWDIRTEGLPTFQDDVPPEDVEIGFISDIAVDPADPDVAYATSSTFGIEHVYRTTDGGATWSSIDGISDALGVIPDIPVHSIAINPLNSNFLYAGTEVGVYASENGGLTWQPANAGLANTVVEELDFQDDFSLIAFTHGRGAFAATLEDESQMPMPCSDADLAEPFEVLNALDIEEAVLLIETGSSLGDFDGSGENDIFDLFIYLELFAAGCP